MALKVDYSGMKKISESLVICDCSTEINPKSYSSVKLWTETVQSILPEGEDYWIIVEKRSTPCSLCGKGVYRVRKELNQ